MYNLEELTLRELQTEAAYALTEALYDNLEMAQFNKKMEHDSQKYYRAVIQHYIDMFGCLPSERYVQQN